MPQHATLPFRATGFSFTFPASADRAIRPPVVELQHPQVLRRRCGGRRVAAADLFIADAAAHNWIVSIDSHFMERLTFMETLTLVIETQLATRARQVAKQRNTTVDSLVTEFLSELTSDDETSRQEAANRLVATIAELSRPMGGKSWSNRDERHDR
jgi:hypothetical protein